MFLDLFYDKKQEKNHSNEANPTKEESLNIVNNHSTPQAC